MELSKFWLYRFLYESLKHIRDVTDPQSLIFQFKDLDVSIIVTKVNFYDFIRNNPELFDTSEFEEVNTCDIPKLNAKKVVS